MGGNLRGIHVFPKEAHTVNAAPYLMKTDNEKKVFHGRCSEELVICTTFRAVLTLSQSCHKITFASLSLIGVPRLQRKSEK